MTELDGSFLIKSQNPVCCYYNQYSANTYVSVVVQPSQLEILEGASFISKAMVVLLYFHIFLMVSSAEIIPIPAEATI